MYHFTKYNPNIVDGTGKSLEDLKGIIDQGQPVLIYHTNLGSKPLLRVSALITSQRNKFQIFT